MKTQTKTVKDFETNTETVSYKCEMGNIDAIAHLLQKATYKYPKQTSIQEYLSNGRDANREAGNGDIPLKVTFPTELNPTIRIRDNGPGLSPERVANVFVKYGNSTKRSSNLETGGFGIGAKSAWSFTDSFEITSYHGGKKYVYLAHKGNTVAGELTLISEEKSNEPTGVEIAITLERDDIATIIAAFYRTTFFWDVKPEVLGVTDECISGEWRHPMPFLDCDDLKVYNKMQGCYDDTHYDMAESIFLESISKGHMAVVDGIPYPLPESNFENIYESYVLAYFFETGDLEISSDRENLVSVSNSDLNTQSFKRFEKYDKQITDRIEELVMAGDDLSDKLYTLENLTRVFNHNFRTVIQYGKKEYSVSTKRSYGRRNERDYSLDINLPVDTVIKNFAWKTDAKSGEKTTDSEVICNDATRIILIDNDLGNGFVSVGKNRTKVKQNLQHMDYYRATFAQIIEPRNQKELDALKKLPLEDLGIELLTELDDVEYAERTNNREKKDKDEFHCRNYYPSHYSDSVKPIDSHVSNLMKDDFEAQLDKVLLVEKNGNSPDFGTDNDYEVAAFCEYFRDKGFTILSIKKDLYAKYTENNPERSFINAVNNIEFKTEAEKMEVIFPLYIDDDFDKELLQMKTDKIQNEMTRLFFETVKDIHKQNVTFQHRRHFIDALNLTDEHNQVVERIDQFRETIKNRYPLIEQLKFWREEINFDHIVDYINAIDK